MDAHEYEKTRDCGVRYVPDCWCDTGLYAKIRHPNYTGELMFWFGNFLAGLPAMVFSGVWPMIPALIGGSFINFLMNNQAKGQDEKQAAGSRACVPCRACPLRLLSFVRSFVTV